MRIFNYLEDHGPTSLSVVDEHRNSVTITSSINPFFGSKVASPPTGFYLNNQMEDFATPGRANFFGLSPSESNYIVPGKMLSSNTRSTDGASQEDTDELGNLVLSLEVVEDQK